MESISDKVFPQPEGEWIGAKIYSNSEQNFRDFELLIYNYGYTEKTAAKLATTQVSDWPDDVRFKLRGY